MEVDTSSATTWRVVNIIKEECIKVGNPVEEALICCVLKMIYDNPKNGFDSDLPMDRHAVRRLIGKSFCLVNLSAADVFLISINPTTFTFSENSKYWWESLSELLRQNITG